MTAHCSLCPLINIKLSPAPPLARKLEMDNLLFINQMRSRLEDRRYYNCQLQVKLGQAAGTDLTQSHTVSHVIFQGTLSDKVGNCLKICQ